MNSPITYIPGVFAGIDFKSIDEEIEWEQRDAPRSESYYAKKNIPYTYGKGAGERTYFPRLPHNGDSNLSITWQHELTEGLELLFCNRYADQHQHLGWHADDSPAIDVNRPIVVVTFGAEREIWFKPIDESSNLSGMSGIPRPPERLLLQHGSVLVMHPGMQQTHLHRIPKHSAPCGPRVSLTFRGLAPGFITFEEKH